MEIAIYKIMKLKTFYFINIIILLGIFCCSSFAYAASPVIFYSDLTSGPKTGGQNNKGVFVTINGKNFGTTRGTSYVSIGGGQADNYPIWTDAKIVFQLGANAATGRITVTTAEGTASGVTFTVRAGNIYFVDISTDASGDGSFTDPWDSPADFYRALTAGDICYIKAGSYTGEYGWAGWGANLCAANKDGTAANPIAFVGYPGEVAYFSGQNYCFRFSENSDYWVISNLKFTPGLNSVALGGTGWRVVNTITDFDEGGNYYAIGSSGTDMVIYGNEIYGGSGENLLHGIYIGYGQTNFDVGWNYLHDNIMGYQIQVHQDGGATFSGSIHDNLLVGTTARGINIGTTSTTTDVDIYNNIVATHGTAFHAGVSVNSGRNVNVYNNTIIPGTGAELPCIKVETLSGTGNLKNNIMYSTGSNFYIEEWSAGDRATWNIDANCFYGSTAATYGTNKVLSNPLFVDAANYDFRLQSTSPCKDQGADTSSLVLTDKNGVLRPQNSIVDIGAYEYSVASSDVTAPSVISNLSAVTGDNEGQVKLSWTAVGDDGNAGTAVAYIGKYSTAVISSDAGFYAASDVSGEPVPAVAGTSQNMTVSGLTAGQLYYFAIKVRDEAPNTSALSNVPSAAAKAAGVVVDNTPPYTTGHIPAKSAINIAPDANIVVHVKDDGAGVDINTIVMKVNGVVVTPTITGTPADYTLTYDPANNFTTGQAVSVTVEASDLAP